MKNDDMIDFLIEEFGENVLVNGIEKRVLIKDYQDKISENDDKIIKTDFEINTGDTIYYQGQEWIIISDIDKNEKSYEARIRKSDYSIKMYIDSKLHDISTIIESNNNFTIDSNDYINVAAGNIFVTLKSDNITNLIKEGNRFIKMGSAWKVIGIDKTKKGLMILNCEKDLFDSLTDDIEGEIANRWEYETKHEYVITANGNVSLNIGETYQITVSITDNGIAIENPVLIYTSSDETICDVNETGLVTTIGIGTTTITIKYENVEAAFNVEISEAPIVKPMVINGDYKLYLNTSRTYTITYDDGTAIADETFTYSFANTSLATITGFTGTNVTLKANNSNIKGYCDLVCTCVEDSSIIIVKNIWVRSLI